MNEVFEMDGSYVLHPAPVKLEAGTRNIQAIYGLNAAIKYIQNTSGNILIDNSYIVNNGFISSDSITL